jgi:hypothetical protein
MDAMEFVPPEDWPVVLERFRRALRSGGWLYLTVELAPGDLVRAGNQAARRLGLLVVHGDGGCDGRCDSESPAAPTPCPASPIGGEYGGLRCGSDLAVPARLVGWSEPGDPAKGGDTS